MTIYRTSVLSVRRLLALQLFRTFAFAVSAGRPAAQQTLECCAEVLVEDVIDDGIDQRAAVGQPLQTDQHLWR